MLNIKNDDDGLVIDRADLIQSAIEDLKEDLGDTLLVNSITNNSVTFGILDELNNYQDMTVNISDQDVDFSLKLITLALISNKFNQLPKVGFLLKVSDSSQDENSPIKDDLGEPEVVSDSSESDDYDGPYIDIVGLSVIDLTGVLYSDVSSHEYDYTVEVSSSYIQNAFQQNGIISLSRDDLDGSRKLFLNSKPESFIDPDDEFLRDKHEVSMGTLNQGIALQENRARKRWKRTVRLNRRKDAAGHRLRAIAARLRWKKFRGKILRSMKKFRNTRAGKLSIMRRGRKLSMLNKLGLIGKKDGY